MARRSGLRATKTFVGVVILVVAAFVLGAAGVRTVASILNTGETQLQRWVDGRAGVRQTFPDAGVSLEFPDEVQASLEPVSLYLAGSAKGKRYIWIVDKDAVEFVWFALPPSLIGSKDLPKTIGNFVADGLGGPPLDATTDTKRTPNGYRFRVRLKLRAPVATTTTEPGASANKASTPADYYVYVFVQNSKAYVLRVRTTSKGFAALEHFRDTLRVVSPASK